MAICFSGTSAGALLLPFLTDYLITTYSLRGAFLILSALELHICMSACLFRPPSDHAIVQEKDRRKQINKELDKNNLQNRLIETEAENNNRNVLNKSTRDSLKKFKELPIKCTNSSLSPFSSMPLLYQKNTNEISSTKILSLASPVMLEKSASETHVSILKPLDIIPETNDKVALSTTVAEETKCVPKDKVTVRIVFHKIADFFGFDIAILKTSTMILTSVSAVFFSLACPHAMFYLHAYYKSVGVGHTQVTRQLGIIAFADLIGRYNAGFITDKKWMRFNTSIAFR